MSVYKKSAEMRNSILAAMEHVVLEKGYQKTGIKDIADYLEIPRSLIYYYFKNKHSIMAEIYRKHFAEVGETVSKVLPRGREPLVRLMLSYLLFFRMIMQNPLFTEFIVLETPFAALGKVETASQITDYYDDSRDVFEYFGKPTNGKDFLIHAIMLESVGRALISGIYYKTVDLTEYEAMECIGERIVMPSFGLGKEEMKTILDRTFTLADQARDIS